MVKDDNNNIQNLVLNEKPDGTFETLLAIYQMTEEEYKNIDYYSLIQKEVKFYPIEFDQNGLMQFKFANPYAHTTCDIQWTWTEVENDKGDLRDDMPGTHFIWQASFLCTFSGGGGGGDGGGDASTGQTGSNGNNNPNNNENPQGSSGSGGGGVSSGNPNTTGGVYGNGGLDGTGITTTPVVSSTLTIKQIKQNFLTTANLNQQQLDWWNSNTNSAMVTLLSTYLFNNQIIDVDMPNQYEFAVWAINYNISHPATTPEKFSNWFMTPREGIDGNYDQSYWEDPNLNFQSQSLPTFADFDAAYPRQSGTVLIGIIGGDVEQAYINNPNNVRGFCALKVSKGLNDSGVTIPNIPGKTIKGGDNNYYFLNAKALNVWMRKTFGVSPTNSSHIRITNSQAGVNGENLPTLTANIKGIYSLVSSNPNWASGHADLLNANGTCIFGCHFSDAPIDFIDIWILN
jgi:hypothetical protein